MKLMLHQQNFYEEAYAKNQLENRASLYLVTMLTKLHVCGFLNLAHRPSRLHYCLHYRDQIWRCSPITLKQVSSRCSFFDPHLTTHPIEHKGATKDNNQTYTHLTLCITLFRPITCYVGLTTFCRIFLTFNTVVQHILQNIISPT